MRPRQGGGYEVVAGERRYRAAKLAGLDTLDAVVREISDREARPTSITENLNREDLNPYEETVGVLDLVGLELSDAPNWAVLLEEHEGTREAVAWVLRQCAKSYPEIHPSAVVKLGITAAELEGIFAGIFGERSNMTVRSFVNNRLPLLRLPEDVREALERGDLEYTKATLIGNVDDDEKRHEILRRTIHEKLPWQTVSELVAAAKRPVVVDDEFIARIREERRGIARYWRYSGNLNANDQR